MSDDSIFRAAVEEVLRHEGGHVNDPRDPGGETKFGISKRSYPTLAIADLTRDDAIAIYRRDFWDRLHGDDLPPALALVVFDTAVNMGRERAVRLLQQALDVTVDGVLGPKTISAAALAALPWMVTDYLARRAFVYGSLVTFQTFGLGWMRRTLQIHEAALALVKP